MSTLPVKRPHSFLYPPIAWIAIFGFGLVIAIGLLVHAGRVLNVVIPGGAFAVGALLYWRYPLIYISFTWWMWFLSPWLRRLVDYQSGWTDPSPILLTPLLVMAIALVSFFRNLPKAAQQGGLPFILCGASAVYGALVGAIQGAIAPAIVALLNWMMPVVFGFFVLTQWRDYPKLRQTTQQTFLWGTAVMGAYGIWQYLVAPAWDQFWMINVDTPVFGTPEPFGIRVFGTMHSPQPYAFVLVTGLIIVFSSSSPVRFLAAGFGYMGVLISLARSAWIQWLIALAIYASSLKFSAQVRLITLILALLLCVYPLATLKPFSDTISARVETLSGGKTDRSYSERAEGYSQILSDAFSEVWGIGIGNYDKVFLVRKYSIGAHDSAFLETLLSLGLFGGIPYLLGHLLLLLMLLQPSSLYKQPFLNASRAIALSIYTQFFLNSAMISVFGAVLWFFLGLLIAARRYFREYESFI